MQIRNKDDGLKNDRYKVQYYKGSSRKRKVVLLNSLDKIKIDFNCSYMPIIHFSVLLQF